MCDKALHVAVIECGGEIGEHTEAALESETLILNQSGQVAVPKTEPSDRRIMNQVEVERPVNELMVVHRSLQAKFAQEARRSLVRRCRGRKRDLHACFGARTRLESKDSTGKPGCSPQTIAYALSGAKQKLLPLGREVVEAVEDCSAGHTHLVAPVAKTSTGEN